MADINLRAPLTQLAADVREGRLTAVELVQASLAAIDATSSYNALLEVSEQALESAAEVDQLCLRYRESNETGKLAQLYPLAGIPFAAKDNYLTKTGHTTAASHMLEPFEAPYEGPVLARLRAAGAIMVAKANLDAYAHGASTENSDFGPTKNPHDETRVPGGSSGGSAASVALGQVCFALGTDTGGSIRLPASYCGVVGLKPTYGLVPRTGVVAMASSLDVLGPLTNSVDDAALVLDIMAGHDASDATTIKRDAKSYVQPSPSLKGLRVGIIKQHIGDGISEPVRDGLNDAIAKLKQAGALVEEVSIPAVELSLAAYYILMPAEVSSNLARYDGVRYGYSSPTATDLESTYRLSREEGFGSEAKRRIMLGTYVLSSGYYDAYYKRAQKVRTKLIEEFKTAFESYDILIGPTAPGAAFKLGAKADDPLAMYLCDVMTVAANLVGIPGISIPMGDASNLPIGLQLHAAQRDERRLLGVARSLERPVTVASVR